MFMKNGFKLTSYLKKLQPSGKGSLVLRKYQNFHSYPQLEEHPGSFKTNVWPILSLAKVVKMHGFHGNPLTDSQEWGCTYKIICISAVVYPRLPNLVPNSSLYKGENVRHSHVTKTLNSCMNICAYSCLKLLSNKKKSMFKSGNSRGD